MTKNVDAVCHAYELMGGWAYCSPNAGFEKLRYCMYDKECRAYVHGMSHT